MNCCGAAGWFSRGASHAGGSPAHSPGTQITTQAANHTALPTMAAGFRRPLRIATTAILPLDVSIVLSFLVGPIRRRPSTHSNPCPNQKPVSSVSSLPISLLGYLLPQSHPRFLRVPSAHQQWLSLSSRQMASGLPLAPSLCAQYPLVYSSLGLTGARRGLPRISVGVRQCSRGESQWGTDPSTGETKLSLRTCRFLPIQPFLLPLEHHSGRRSKHFARDQAPTDVPSHAGPASVSRSATKPGSPDRVCFTFYRHCGPSPTQRRNPTRICLESPVIAAAGPKTDIPGNAFSPRDHSQITDPL